MSRTDRKLLEIEFYFLSFQLSTIWFLKIQKISTADWVLIGFYASPCKISSKLLVPLHRNNNF